jgi:hypothetical protein
LRWQAFVGKDGILESTGQTFAAVKADRAPAKTTPPKRKAGAA